jgi:predicted AAA+ superfamily ATPase
MLIKTELCGKAFENWAFHELCSSDACRETFAGLSYWRLASGMIEVDFIVNDMRAAIEAKASKKITRDHLKGLRAPAQDHS